MGEFDSQSRARRTAQRILGITFTDFDNLTYGAEKRQLV
ncbi:hypothetical protein MPNT_50019 [Candidatus Methylacidithermus pantelleriae]|uniref:Uncharacterized protein n=1 Tax=Candidatus Methylacidithermus pantelleriae TaxID=2744239 RepID=A0A8J2BPV6_9BACT|nr:hypothetical protein MPNT_50019 [Candidatus Methylacidithermus pantelleriae]